MIHEYEITIGSILRTNKGEIIRVESISTKRQHRKVGYHTPDDPYRIKYVRLAQCEGVELTPEILEKNGWKMLSNFDRETYYSEGGEFNLDYHNGELRLIIHSCVVIIEYVHQLQFALICAGLPELAKKLKVE